MRIVFDPRAADELEGQIDYLLEQHARAAAARLEARCMAFLETFLVTYPRSGKFIAEASVWETWIPGTRLVVWYRFSVEELQIIRIWHASQVREA